MKWKMQKNADNLRCSFCGKSQKEVAKLIAGPTVYICNECVNICNEILDDDGVPRRTREDEAARYLKRAQNDLAAAKSLIDLSHFRVAVNLARESARAALTALLIKEGGHPTDENIEVLLSLALNLDERLRQLRELNATRLITQYAFDDEVIEADARQAAGAAQQIVEFVSAEMDAG